MIGNALREELEEERKKNEDKPIGIGMRFLDDPCDYTGMYGKVPERTEAQEIMLKYIKDYEQGFKFDPHKVYMQFKKHLQDMKILPKEKK